MFKIMKSKAGITLMELLVCVVILGILAGVAVPSFVGVVRKHRIADCKNQRLTVQCAVQEIMTGMYDNGAPQNLIPTLCTVYAGQHKVYTYRVVKDDKGETVTDKNGKAVTEVETGWKNKELFYLEDHIDNNNDGICDACKNSMKFYFRGSNHIDSSHLVYYDADGNKLNADNEGIETNEFNITAIKDATAFLLVSKATISDIRGGYRYSELSVQKSWVTKRNEDLAKQKAELAEINKKKNNGKWANYASDEAHSEAVTACMNKYTGAAEQRISTALNTVQNSTAKAANNPNYACKDYTYKIGCNDGYFLKKFVLGDTPLVDSFANGEMPKCPFDKNGEKGYFYYISADGTVHCSCPECG